MISLGKVEIEWFRGFPAENGHYLVELQDGEHVVTPYTVPGQEGQDTWGDQRRSGWSCLTHAHTRVVAWARIPQPRKPQAHQQARQEQGGA